MDIITNAKMKWNEWENTIEYTREKIIDEFRNEILSWNWESILDECKENTYKNDDGYITGSHFLGSVFSLTPSGKYYQPFACSNVQPCDVCNGNGSLPEGIYIPNDEMEHSQLCESYIGVLGENDNGIPIPKIECYICHGRGIRQALAYMNPNWMKENGIQLGEWFDCNVCNGSGMVNATCPNCLSTGSYEAMLDECFNTALDEIAESNGGYIASGEGDPTDIFFELALDESEFAVDEWE